jgi:hypothetical protein
MGVGNSKNLARLKGTTLAIGILLAVVYVYEPGQNSANLYAEAMQYKAEGDQKRAYASLMAACANWTSYESVEGRPWQHGACNALRAEYQVSDDTINSKLNEAGPFFFIRQIDRAFNVILMLFLLFLYLDIFNALFQQFGLALLLRSKWFLASTTTTLLGFGYFFLAAPAADLKQGLTNKLILSVAAEVLTILIFFRIFNSFSKAEKGPDSTQLAPNHNVIHLFNRDGLLGRKGFIIVSLKLLVILIPPLFLATVGHIALRSGVGLEPVFGIVWMLIGMLGCISCAALASVTSYKRLKDIAGISKEERLIWVAIVAIWAITVIGSSLVFLTDNFDFSYGYILIAWIFLALKEGVITSPKTAIPLWQSRWFRVAATSEVGLLLVFFLHFGTVDSIKVVDQAIKYRNAGNEELAYTSFKQACLKGRSNTETLGACGMLLDQYQGRYLAQDSDRQRVESRWKVLMQAKINGEF